LLPSPSLKERNSSYPTPENEGLRRKPIAEERRQMRHYLGFLGSGKETREMGEAKVRLKREPIKFRKAEGGKS